jgi:NIPSNAP protein
MQRRELLTALAASALITSRGQAAAVPNTFLELKTWRLHNSAENQATRLADYLEHGLTPAVAQAGAKVIGAFSNVIGQDGPYYITLTQYPSLAVMQDVLTKLAADSAYHQALEKLSANSGAPFVRVESSLLRSFDGLPVPVVPSASEKRPARIFELRTYESPSYTALARKVGMFNHGEMQIFQRLGLRPIFFGETIVGPKQPNLTYMLSYDDMTAHDKLWAAFGSDPEWKKLRVTPGLTDPEVVTNISNVILRPLAFSLIR